MKKAFSIFPITIKPPFKEYYKDVREKHFLDVYNFLIKPAATRADFQIEPSVAVGTQNILQKIADQLQESDLVICDISCANPNVFFELGIRYALNKRFCLIKDNKKINQIVPFDVFAINHHIYDSSLSQPGMSKEITALKKHILSCYKTDPPSLSKKDESAYLPNFDGVVSDISDLLFSSGADAVNVVEKDSKKRSFEIKYRGEVSVNILSYAKKMAEKNQISVNIKKV